MFRQARIPPAPVASVPRAPHSSPPTQVSATARTTVVRSTTAAGLLVVIFVGGGAGVIAGHADERFYRGADARAETYPFEPRCRVEFAVEVLPAEVADGD